MRVSKPLPAAGLRHRQCRGKSANPRADNRDSHRRPLLKEWPSDIVRLARRIRTSRSPPHAAVAHPRPGYGLFNPVRRNPCLLTHWGDKRGLLAIDRSSGKPFEQGSLADLKQFLRLLSPCVARFGAVPKRNQQSRAQHRASMRLPATRRLVPLERPLSLPAARKPPFRFDQDRTSAAVGVRPYRSLSRKGSLLESRHPAAPPASQRPFFLTEKMRLAIVDF
jgi:hypothetical protein